MTDAIASDVILSVRDLRAWFETRRLVAKAVDGVTFDLKRGKTLAVVGESGSGKSVTSLSIMGLVSRPGRIAGGKILFRDRQQHVHDLAGLTQKEFRTIRGREIAMIFQEPMTSLNPLYTVGDQISEMIVLHEPVNREQARSRALAMLKHVEIPDAVSRLDDYPHQMSGGMRQRVMIAMALACNPSLLIADEPTTALDVTIQAQILDLLRRLQVEMGMSILFITHNLGVVAEIAHDVVVMYGGRVVEQAPVNDLFAHQRHPYTRGLLACTPNAARDIAGDGERRALYSIPGSVPPITALPPGCAFEPRCDFAIAPCRAAPPPLMPAGPHGASRCIRSAEL
ncbi:ABC transporter ATP-binding protein [Mesorhizobium sp. M00.F.Ca.ET.216.01.1.1]|uniref:ABC transporter ATP-binding protein n=1 Tax=Mesorhizobium sp. M00.F.Ca.ET.216.01.1.1 TaxID=2500528 RepID=UPI000FD87529|nr:ABC transporter ATP-binding protein [Mesorhizobium sp. M00.F.Ca.ET.216.01.1.1]TGQ46970.1 ABC transporter ATP-binding protein [Mesorhizobium sp. M00.F.Ca.ET.216.01.1.1]